MSEKSTKSLDRIIIQMSSSLNVSEVLSSITQGLVDGLNASFARIWLLEKGDICKECINVEKCFDRKQCLHLKASAGIYTNLKGEYSRVPLGSLKIGRIAQDKKSLFTNDVQNDDRLPNKKWLKKNNLKSFAGYPLIFRDELLGVIAMFSEQSIEDEVFELLPVFASQAAIAIKNAQLFDKVNQLNKQLQAEKVYLQEEIKLNHNFEEIISQSKVFKKELTKVEQVAETDATVLITGESGTGKELIARAIHNLSKRKNSVMVKVNCAALPATLIESELFGHEKGAFTGALQKKIGRFELANNGTIFLDEIGELPIELQSKLLRVLQEGEFERLGNPRTMKVNIRVIAATNRDLNSEILKGKFREDLFYRLNVFPIIVPPLRDRVKDVELLTQHLLLKHSNKMGKKISIIPKLVMDPLINYSWPGNVRELENVIERAVIITSGNKLDLGDWLPQKIKNGNENKILTLVESETNTINKALEATNWKISGEKGAANLLNIKRTTLESRMKKLNIKRP